MNIIITSLLTISLLVVAPGCKQEKCVATYIDPASGDLKTETVVSIGTNDDAKSISVKC